MSEPNNPLGLNNPLGPNTPADQNPGQNAPPRIVIVAPVDDPTKGSLGLGFAIGIGGNVIFGGLGVFLMLTFQLMPGLNNNNQLLNAFWVLGTLGVSQIIWLAPAAIYFGAKGFSRTVAGLLLAGGLIFLLNVVLIASGVAFVLTLCAGAGR